MRNILHRTTMLLATSLVVLASSYNVSEAEPCAVDQTKTDCRPKCDIFYNVQPGQFPVNMIHAYAGRDLKDFSDDDLNHLRSDFVFCNATQSINMIHGVPDADFPAFVNSTIDDLKSQRDMQVHRTPANPTQAALLACPVALDHIKRLQVLIDKQKSQHLDPNSQEGMQSVCAMMQSQMEIVDQYIDDLQQCKRNGIVGLQPLVQLSQASNEQTERQFHEACD